MKEFTKYIEDLGIKYFVALSAFFYIIGTVIFNIYLRTVLGGAFEFSFNQLRYVFVGITFSLTLAFFIGGVLFGRWLYVKFYWKKKPTKRMKDLFRKRMEIIIALSVIPWTLVYSLFIFPNIPSAFGGAKPTLGRLVGQADKIQRINEMIAFETGVPVEKLPFEKAAVNSDLAIGANVKILDQNDKNIYLILTKELYLESTSSLAKNLIASGEKVETAETLLLRPKPLVVKAADVETVLYSLYTPKEVTGEDLKLAAEVLAKNPTSASKVAEGLAQDKETANDPEFQKAIEHIKNTDSTVGTPEENTEAMKTSLENINFLNFRAEIFNQALKIADWERQNGDMKAEREALVSRINQKLQTDFPQSWQNLTASNYLVLGLEASDFPRKLAQLFQGAPSAVVVVERLNTTEPKAPDVDGSAGDELIAEENAFENILHGAQETIEAYNEADSSRKSASTALMNYFTQKAPRQVAYWRDTQYIPQGTIDPNYVMNMKVILRDAHSWESLGLLLSEAYADIPTTEVEGIESGSGAVNEERL